MPTKDIRSSLRPEAATLATITSNTTTNGGSISVADFDNGIQFVVSALVFTDGTFDFVVEESETGSFSGEQTVVPAEKIIGTLAAAQITGATSEGDTLGSFGVFSVKGFLRVNVVSTSVTSGATILVQVNKMAELSPTV